MAVDRWLREGPDARLRCWWAVGDDPDRIDHLYLDYHDTEWGRPVTDDRRLFEKICLEGFQAGLAWITILRKRDRFREVFEHFDPAAVARFGESDVERLLGDAGIIRHRGKIEATISNAARALEAIDEFGSLAAHLWSFEPSDPTDFDAVGDSPIPSTTPASETLSRALKTRGWRFVGPTTVYAFMQAMGMVNDHLPGCAAREVCEAERAALRRPVADGSARG
ncbi:MAG: DNA-3-methyladenine glycosylase I [Acidimicrobiales bacterium]